MTKKYKFGKIEKHQGDNNKPRRNKNGQEWPGMAKNGEDCHRLLMTTKYKFGMIKKHQGDNNTPRRMKVAKNGEDCYRW